MLTWGCYKFHAILLYIVKVQAKEKDPLLPGISNNGPFLVAERKIEEKQPQKEALDEPLSLPPLRPSGPRQCSMPTRCPVLSPITFK